MKNHKSLFTNFSVLIVSVTLAALFATAAMAQDLQAKLDAYIAPFVETGSYSGSILIARHGEIIAGGGYGFADFENDVPNTLQSKFAIGSLGKQFVAVGILQLQEQGKLSVQDKVRKYLKDYRYGNDITIHHLLTHTSGVPEVVGDSTDSRDLLKELGKQRLVFKPGTNYQYSNTGFWMLGLILEKAAGMSTGEYLHKNLWGPLEMNDTDYDLGVVMKHRADGYIITHRGMIDRMYTTGPRGGQIFSTVLDLLKWDRGLKDGKLLNEDSMAMLYTNYGHDYGYGVNINENYFGDRSVGHGGIMNGYRCNLIRLQTADITIIYFTNIYNSPVRKIANDITAMTLGQEVRPYPVRHAVAFNVNLLKPYVGRYKDDDEFVLEFLVEGGNPWAILRYPSGAVGRFPVFASGLNTFFMYEFDADIVFPLGTGDQVDSMQLIVEGQVTDMKRDRSFRGNFTETGPDDMDSMFDDETKIRH